jgi:hypothetical protein
MCAEAYDVLHVLGGLSNDEIAAVFAEWNQGELQVGLRSIQLVIIIIMITSISISIIVVVVVYSTSNCVASPTNTCSAGGCISLHLGCVGHSKGCIA